MTESKLPVLKNKSLPETSQASVVETIKGLRTNRTLLVSGLIASTGAAGLFLLTQYTIFSVVLAVVGIAFFGARQLVKKSLALTANNNQLQLGSVQHQLEQIKKQVSKCKFLENVESEGVRASNQAEQLLNQYKSLKNILSQKFEPAELTFSRYLDSIDKSCLSIGENMVHAKSILENLNLTAANKSSEWLEQQKHALGLLQTTEEALRELALLFNSINEITTKEKHRAQFEQSMQQIKELAERAKIYSKH